MAFTSSAWALTPGQIASDRSSGNLIEIFFAGATAEKNTLPALLGGRVTFTRYGFSYTGAGSLCQPGSLDIYYDAKAGGRAGYDYRAYACTLTTNTDLLGAYPELAGKDILIHYRMKNGSWYGTGPVARSQPVAHMIVNANCTTSRPPNTGATPVPVAPAFPLASGTSPTAYNVPSYICPTESTVGGVTTINTAQLTADVPDVGIADNEPAIFVGQNAPFDGNAFGGGNPTGDAAMTTGDVANLTTTPVFAVTLGIAASKKLVNALQSAQGLTPTVVGSLVADADRPNINFPQITSFLTANGGPYNTNWAGLITGDTHNVNICRRISAVATQIAANAYWGNYPCSRDGTPPAIPTSSTSTYRVIENDLIPDERICLQGFNNGTSFARGVTDTGASIMETVSTAADGNYAIGPLFTDNSPSSETFNWDFLKIDGVDPTVVNTVAGKYRYINTAVINMKVGSAAADTSTSKGKLRDLIFSGLSSPAVLAVQNGFLALPDLGYVPGTDGNNILRGTTGAKTCSPQTLFF